VRAKSSAKSRRDGLAGLSSQKTMVDNMPLGHAHGGVHKINHAAAREETGVENFQHTVIVLDQRAAEAEFAVGPGGKII